ncbi:uncharacterized protein C17orf98-like [Lingula anatina]|uniref:Uncharacterized protein C17orf98-like n=1 Tax=Lingula anatina TaxID=7574 RepID=A0A1S3H350_LINAN|nr:uncharacterized protein C17orf98-like [Lingula anatina]|eukprot:XP_013380560.1 uncharacterized protein C17orf98-like [Lingula anatina]
MADEENPGSPTAGSPKPAESPRQGSPRRDSPRHSVASAPRSPRSPRKSRANKIYRTPPTPPPEEMLAMEKGFIRDNIACGSIAGDYAKANPKVGPVVPPYNGQKDKHARPYFGFHSVPQSLKFYDQEDGGCSIEGKVMDRFHEAGAGHQYLVLRNQFGAGHSSEDVDGHSQFMQGVKPVIGYHGPYGFRRNTPWLRAEPSPFGPPTRSPLH